MYKIVVILLAFILLSPAVYAARKADYSKEASDLHKRATYDTEILELQALYYQNKDIINRLDTISKSLKDIVQSLETLEEVVKELNEQTEILKENKAQ